MKVSPISTETGISALKSVLTIVRIPKVLATPSQLMGRFYQNIPNGTRKSEACGEPGGWGAPTGGGGQTSRTRITRAHYTRALPVRRDGDIAPYRHYARKICTPFTPPSVRTARAPWCGPVAVGRDAWPPGLPARSAAPLPVAARHRGASGAAFALARWRGRFAD